MTLSRLLIRSIYYRAYMNVAGFSLMHLGKKVCLNILKVLFERLRDANVKISQLQSGASSVEDIPDFEAPSPEGSETGTLVLDLGN